MLEKKGRDHCHVTGKYRGAAHWSCNINLKLSKKIPIIFYNLRGYDSHLIIKEITKSDIKVSVLQNGLEKYMAFTINRSLVFIDSIQFMNSSLDTLVKNLRDNDFKYLSEEFSGEFLKLVKQKGVYTYEYMDSFKKFSEDKLPDSCKFFNCLKDFCISEKVYLKANNIWNVFKINAMSDYHDLYLKTDLLLLADVFKKFINGCLDYYGLDPCHYFSSPGLSWDAMLKMTKIQLDLIDMHLFIEKEMRSGISYITKRHSKANNTHMECYDSSKESIYITYLDANNLYGWEIGYILEVDLEYPSELHDLRNDYPLAPETFEISQNMLSNYCPNIANEYGIKVGGVNKLVPNLGNKSKYVVHYRNLQLYLSLGMKLTKVNRILKFKQPD